MLGGKHRFGGGILSNQLVIDRMKSAAVTNRRPEGLERLVDERDSRLEFLRAFLAERDLPCPLCGYNLRALRSEKCPECGSEVEVTVGLTEPRMAAFIAGVVGLAAGLGFCALILLWVGWLHVTRDGGPGLNKLWMLPIGVVVNAVALRIWLGLRRRIRTMSRRKQWVAAVACFWLSLAVAVGFFATAGT